MTVLVQENHAAPVATVRCFVRNTGSAMEGRYEHDQNAAVEASRYRDSEEGAEAAAISGIANDNEEPRHE